MQTRKPTGVPSWPIVLLAGAEKSGKSWACAAASGSELIGRTLWIPIGEDDPDEYGAVAGARFEIVQHDGTLRGIGAATSEAVEALAGGDRPGLLVIDSMSRLWALITDMAQEEANRRAREKARRYGRAVPDGDAQITMDLWNAAKERWEEFIDLLRGHQGPVLLTARLSVVTVMDGDKPTREKDYKVEAHKSLPFDAGAVVMMPQRGETILSGVRSVRMQVAEPVRVQQFTVDWLWREMGLDEAAGERVHTGNRARSAATAQPSARAVMWGLMQQAGIDSQEAALAWLTEALGREITDTRQLTDEELDVCIGALSVGVDRGSGDGA